MKQKSGVLRRILVISALVWLCLFWATLAFAQGPSFDCSKAKTKVERAICGNEELSRLDRELADTYKKLYDQLEQAERNQIKKGQLEWLKQRDREYGKTPDEDLVNHLKPSYEKRIGELRVWNEKRKGGKQAGVEGSRKPKLRELKDIDFMTKKYPPYPDVWGCELPCPGRGPCDRGGSPQIVPSGDVVILYRESEEQAKGAKKGEKIIRMGGMAFFSGERVLFTSDEVNDFDRKYRSRTEDRVTFSDGSMVKYERGGLGNCSPEYYDPNIALIDKEGKIIAEKMLVQLLDKPFKDSVNRDCERNWRYDKDYIWRGARLFRARFISLKDDTFLAWAFSSNLIIRFDKNLNTKSDLLNRKLFLVDGVEWRMQHRKGLAARGQANDQVQNDVVVEYLKSLRTGGKR